MAKPRVFISSTYYDLKHIRSSLDQFVKSLGFDTVLSEKGDIPYTPDLPLDESCYKEVGNVDIFVLIIGSQYGSAASDQNIELDTDFFDKYDSITKKEYEEARERNIPIYILIDSNVYTEYRTYQRNKEKEDINYAHVDSVNVYKLIDHISSQTLNNPIYSFNKSTEIESWLREQWAGLFKDMLSRRSEENQLASLASQIRVLSEINTTLKNYLEDVLKGVPKEDADDIIKREEYRLAEARINEQFEQVPIIKELIESYGVSREDAKSVYTEATSIDDLLIRLSKLSDIIEYDKVIDHWKNDNRIETIKNINKARKILGLDDLKFEDEL